MKLEGKCNAKPIKLEKIQKNGIKLNKLNDFFKISMKLEGKFNAKPKKKKT